MRNGYRHFTDRFPSRSLAAVTAIVLTFFVAATGQSAASEEPVAHVNGVTIYQSDLSCAVEASLARKLLSRQRYEENQGSDNDQANNEDALNNLINIELLYQESLKHRFHNLIAESEKRYQIEVKRLGGEDRLAATLLCNKMTPEQFRKVIFRNLSINRLLDKMVYSIIHVTEQEIREYYELNKGKFRKPESVRIRQILIKVPSKPDVEEWHRAQDRAHMIYRDASSGADFVRLARRHSEDPVGASVGGDMGSIQKGNQQAIFSTMIFNLKIGTVTKPIRSHQGFHIIKIVSTTPSTSKTLGEVKPHITTLMRRQRASEMIPRLLSDLKEKAEIEILKDSTRYPVPRSQ